MNDSSIGDSVARCAGLRHWAGCVLVGAVLSGCYTTKVATPAAGVPGGPLQEDRQWFMIAGAVDLSDPAGDECADGVAYAESEIGGIDVLIQIGLGVGGAILGGSLCKVPEDGASREDALAFANCLTFVSALPNFLVGSRSVAYRCRASEPTPDATPAALPPSSTVPEAPSTGASPSSLEAAPQATALPGTEPPPTPSELPQGAVPVAPAPSSAPAAP